MTLSRRFAAPRSTLLATAAALALAAGTLAGCPKVAVADVESGTRDQSEIDALGADPGVAYDIRDQLCGRAECGRELVDASDPP